MSEEELIKRLVYSIIEQKNELSPEALSEWYNVIVEEYRRRAPGELREKLEVKQNPLLPMKFEIVISRRALRYFFEAVESVMPRMPFVTKVYFLKVMDLVREKYESGEVSYEDP